MDTPFNAYVGNHENVPLLNDEGKVVTQLLWGDGVRFIGDEVNAGLRHVFARGKKGWVREDLLDGEALLEIYFIDVGQGDGVLIRTPDFRHLLIDGGFPRSSQPTMRSAADFVDWKFAKDYGLETIQLDVLMASHNDHDHYGGLDDLLDVDQNDQLDCTGVTVESFCHAGLSWWTVNGERSLGSTAEDADGISCFIDLLEDRASALQYLAGAGGKKLQGAWSKFIRKVTEAKTSAGTPTPLQRLSHLSKTLPGFDAASGSDVEISVLGPLERDANGSPGLKKLGGDSISTNGHSILLRLDFGDARILITGDLNKASQRDLLAQYAGNEKVFACDVAKACHHGSEDVSFTFLSAMKPGATVISSGDAEGHDHPRPRIVGASGVTGHVTFEDDELKTPLVYSTEIARSVLLGHVESATLANGQNVEGEDLKKIDVKYSVHKPGSLRPENGHRHLHDAFVVAGLVYGLVNVRTDGTTIMCATLNEGKNSWTRKTFTSRFAR